MNEMVTVAKAQPSIYNDVDSFKEIVFQNDREEDFADGKLLTSLVRESYLRRLKEMLNKNYQMWFDKNMSSKETGDSEGKEYLISPVDIEKCVKFLEQKALRSCMIGNLYQKSMVNLINTIKQKTNKSQLCDELSTAAVDRQWVSTAGASTQTDILISIDKECQTVEENSTNSLSKGAKNNRLTTSLLDLPLPDPKDVLLSLSSDFIDRHNPKMNLNLVKPTNYPKETVAKVHPTPRKLVEPPQGKNATDCSSVVKNKVHISVPDSEGFSRESKRRKLYDSYCGNLINIVPEDKQIINNTELINMLTDEDSSHNDKFSSSGKNNYNCNINNNSNSVDDFMNTLESCIYSDNISSTENPKLVSHESYNPDHMNAVSLDDRLAELGVFANDESNISSTNSKISAPALSSKAGYRRSWYMESVAYYCNFAKLFLSLDSGTRNRVRDRLRELFGEDEEDDNIVLTPELISVCRKRTANMVVAELTPYFAANKFESRFLFKEFAKRVTNSIMSRTYASDSSSINQFVREYFNEHSAVNSLADIDF